MQNALLNNDKRISGYLDSLLIDAVGPVIETDDSTEAAKDFAAWDEKLAQAVASSQQAATMDRNVSLSLLNPLGTGNNAQKRIQLFDSIALARSLPEGRLKQTVVLSCLPLAAEAMIGG